MATYRCLVSGNTVTFTLPHDIDSMKGHAGYIRIDEPEEEIKKELVMEPPKRVGRPPKQKDSHG